MSPVEKFKKYFNKEDFDYSHGQINPFEFHKTFYYLCKIFGVLVKEETPKWVIIIPIMVCFCGSIAATLCFLSLMQYITIFKIPLITEAGTYFIIMIYKLLIISCPITDKIYYRKLLQAMRDDFKYICTDGNKYREKFFQYQLWTWKASILSGIFIAFIGGGMMVCAHIALVYFVLQHHTEGVRPLPFSFYVQGVDFGKTPIYEITFIFSNMCVCSHTFTYIYMMQAQIVWIRQIMSKADIIIWNIEDLLIDVQPTNNVEQKRYYEQYIKVHMVDIIKMHHSMYSLLDDYSEVYRKLLMFEQKLCAPVICLTAYCAVEKMDNGEIPGIMGLLCIAVIILVYIPSYMCTILGSKIQSIGDACWNTPFWNAPGKVIRPYFILIMQRSTRPLPIQAPGFEEVSLQTFADKMKNAYTGFNMLRQVNYDM